MTVEVLKLKILTPAGPVFPGRGFYQLEEDALYVQITPFSRDYRFFSFLESERVRFDLDKDGRLLFFELALARRRWPVDNRFRVPEKSEPAEIRWLDFRDSMIEPKITTNKKRTAVKLLFSDEKPLCNYELADSVILQTDRAAHLVALYVTEIIDDIAGQEIAAFRHAVLKQQARAERPVSQI
ncbi:MAG: hypothetical protein JXA92_13725 [candidate division Zixibacteria bacterium]|nr:hypothetical protein [candidate division Zixibacteria bacterium]